MTEAAGRPSIRKFLSRVRNLDKVVRFSTMMRLKDENVAEHSYYTALCAMILGDMESKQGKKIDMEKVMRGAILHDMEEAMTGDVIHSFKYGDPDLARKMKEVGLEFYKNMLKDLPDFSEKYLHIWENSKDDTPEGEIIDAADKLEALIYSFEEYSLGNKNFKPVIDHLVEKLKKSKVTSVNVFLKELGLA
jgi:5'-deoxynucleotidase YfbR-like HD superfamily hydrolase